MTILTEIKEIEEFLKDCILYEAGFFQTDLLFYNTPDIKYFKFNESSEFNYPFDKMVIVDNKISFYIGEDEFFLFLFKYKPDKLRDLKINDIIDE